MTNRAPCLVPDCRRTVAIEPRFAGGTEFICAIHWRPVPAELKRRLARAKRLYRRRPSQVMGLACDRRWQACREAALDLAADRINDSALAAFIEQL